MATYLVVLSGFNEAIAIDDWIRILKEAVFASAAMTKFYVNKQLLISA